MDCAAGPHLPIGYRLRLPCGRSRALGLNRCEGRRRLRALQLELHPDKLPSEFRRHATRPWVPLFHLVRTGWELLQAEHRCISKECIVSLQNDHLVVPE